MYAVLTGMLGSQRHGCNVHAKNGGVESPAVEFGGKTRTISGDGDDEGGEENENLARCLGMFQFRRPLYVVVRCET